MSVLSNTGIRAGASAGGSEGLYVEEVFSVDIWNGNGGTKKITNDIDISNEGGLVWIKRTSATERHALFNTITGKDKILATNEQTNYRDRSFVQSIDDDGFTLNTSDSEMNDSGSDYVSFTFRKAPGFFDMVEYTGSNSAQSIAHNLGCLPGMIVIKRHDSNQNWVVWHKSLTDTTSKILNLNETGSEETGSYFWNDTAPTATHFTVGTNSGVNAGGSADYKFTAFLFADGDDTAAQKFGKNGNEAIIKCGLINSTDAYDIGWEPQWLMMKPHTQSGNSWQIYNNRMDMGEQFAEDTGYGALEANDNPGAGQKSAMSFHYNGFQQSSFGSTYPLVYVAIRRGPMKLFEGSASEVFDDVLYTGNSSTQDITITPKYADMIWGKRNEANDNWWWVSQIGGRERHLNPSATSARANRNSADNIEFDRTNAFGLMGNSSGEVNYTGETFISYSFRRWPGFFDMVYYKGTGSSQDIPHSLGVAPAMMIIKKITATEGWQVWHKDLGYASILEMNAGNGAAALTERWNSNPTKTTFNVVSHSSTNASGAQYAAYLFANCDGVSSIGKYDGNSGENVIDCGFTGGARFVMIKQTTNTNDWRVFDASRGINTVGNDDVLSMNLNSAEDPNKNWLEADNSGFKLNTTNDNVNYTGEDYIYMAFA